MQNEKDFAQKYDMTHLLDVEDKEERYQAYLEHLSVGLLTISKKLIGKSQRFRPLGPDWGKTDFKLGHEPVERDAIAEVRSTQEWKMN